MNSLLAEFAKFMWGPWLLVLLLGTGTWLSIRLGGIQIRSLIYAFRLTFSKEREGKGDISHFGSLMTALAATVGMGNIAGVSTAVALGGPGAIFWMWITGLVGMATKYSEAYLAVKYRHINELGEISGGPMYYLEYGLRQKWLGICFAIFGAFAVPPIAESIFPEYTEFSILMPIMSFALIPSNLGLMFLSKILAKEKSKHALISNCIFIGVFVIGIFSLSNVIDITGIALSYFLAICMSTAYLGIIYNRI